MSEPRDVMVKRLKMRSMRRGIKEMDLILSDYAARHLGTLSDDELALYDRILHENDHDIYSWILGTAPVPEDYAAMMSVIAAGAQGVTRPA